MLIQGIKILPLRKIVKSLLRIKLVRVPLWSSLCSLTNLLNEYFKWIYQIKCISFWCSKHTGILCAAERYQEKPTLLNQTLEPCNILLCVILSGYSFTNFHLPNYAGHMRILVSSSSSPWMIMGDLIAAWRSVK